MSDQRTRLSPDAVLWAGAFVLAALLIVHAGRLTANTARAEMVSTAGEYVVLTAQGQNDELLYMIDNRSEDLYVYRTRQQGGMTLLQKQHLPDAFTAARNMFGP